MLSSQVRSRCVNPFEHRQRVINWGIKNLKSDCFNPIKTGGSSEIPKLHKALTYWVKRLSTIKKFQKSNIILEGSRHPNFVNTFDSGKSFHNKSIPKGGKFCQKEITLSFTYIHTSVLNSQMRSGGVKAFKQRESSIGEFEGRFTLSLTSQSTRVILSSDFRISLVFGELYITFITACIYMY